MPEQRLLNETMATKVDEQRSVGEWQRYCHQIAKDKGFHSGNLEERRTKIPQYLCLIHSEISEALEAYREGQISYYEKDGKPEGLAVELADAVIRILDMGEAIGVNIAYAMTKKCEYNLTRPHKHGKEC